MQGVAVAARYPENSTLYGGNPDGQLQEMEASEEEASVASVRTDLYILFRAAAKLIPQQAISFVHNLLQTVLSSPTSTFQVRSIRSSTSVLVS